MLLLLLLSVAGTQLEADLDRAQKEIEQLKTDHDVAIERKDREVGEREREREREIAEYAHQRQQIYSQS